MSNRKNVVVTGLLLCVLSLFCVLVPSTSDATQQTATPIVLADTFNHRGLVLVPAGAGVVTFTLPDETNYCRGPGQWGQNKAILHECYVVTDLSAEITACSDPCPRTCPSHSTKVSLRRET